MSARKFGEDFKKMVVNLHKTGTKEDELSEKYQAGPLQFLRRNLVHVKQRARLRPVKVSCSG